MNKKGAEDSLCKTSHSKCFKTTNFDRLQQIPSRKKSSKFPCQISNSDYGIDKVLVVHFVPICFLHARTSTLICKNTLLLSCLDKEENVCQMTGNGKAFGGQIIKCSLNTIQHKLLPLNLRCEEERLQHFSFPQWLLVVESKTIKKWNVHYPSHADVHVCHLGIAEVKMSLPSPFLAHLRGEPKHLQVFVFEG